jgi:hypothetical protein
MSSSEPDNGFYPLRVAVGFVLGGLLSSVPAYFLSFTAHPGLWRSPHWFFPLPFLLTVALTGAVSGFAIDRTANTAGVFAAGFVSSPFVSMNLPRLLSIFPATWAVFGRSGWIIAMFVIPTLAYGAIGVVAAILSTRYRRFTLGLAAAFLIAAAPPGLIAAFLTHPISFPYKPSFFQGLLFNRSMGFLELFLAGLGTGFVLRHAHAEGIIATSRLEVPA